MRILTFIIYSSLLTLTACIGGNSNTKTKPKFEYGIVQKNTYSNAFLGLEIELPSPWTIDTTKRYKSPFSPHFLEADLFDENQNALLSLNITGHMKNPFSKEETLLSYIQASNSNLGLIYDTNVHREKIDKISIANTPFYQNKIEILVEDQPLYLDEYATEKNGYFYSMTFSYADTLKRSQIREILQKVEIK